MELLSKYTYLAEFLLVKHICSKLKHKFVFMKNILYEGGLRYSALGIDIEHLLQVVYSKNDTQ